MYDIYSNSDNDSLRFTLGKKGNRKLYTVGLNPSTATKERSDPTVARVERVAGNNGFDGFVMLNLYPVRSTDYNALPAIADSRAFLENIAQIEQALWGEPNAVVWAAWGDCIGARPYFSMAAKSLAFQLGKMGVTWKCFGPLTKQGHPRHPSRLHYAWELSAFDADSYVANFA